MTVRRWNVGEKARITEATLKIMQDSNRSCVHPNYPTQEFIELARQHKDIEGEVTHTFPPGYEVTFCVRGQSFHMKDNWIVPPMRHKLYDLIGVADQVFINGYFVEKWEPHIGRFDTADDDFCPIIPDQDVDLVQGHCIAHGLDPKATYNFMFKVERLVTSEDVKP